MIVIKRDNTTQEFDESKIFKVVKAAGLSTEQAEELSQALAQKFANNEQVSSLEIRDEVSSQLHAIDEYAANMFDWYQEQKEEGRV